VTASAAAWAAATVTADGDGDGDGDGGQEETMDRRRMVKISKYLSRHLRHEPDRLGITLDPAGWVEVDELLAACDRNRFSIDRTELEHVVAANDKQRFSFDDTGLRIRANQGHSVPVDLGLPVAEPPPTLFHGTVAAALPQIGRDGLRPMDRHDVHLSPDEETARRVGARRGRPVVLRIDAAAMRAAGYEFRVSANGVWLVPEVPPRYVRRPDDPDARPEARREARPEAPPA
jgi:putative RNA 2'-phosphotransferase